MAGTHPRWRLKCEFNTFLWGSFRLWFGNVHSHAGPQKPGQWFLYTLIKSSLPEGSKICNHLSRAVPREGEGGGYLEPPQIFQILENYAYNFQIGAKDPGWKPLTFPRNPLRITESPLCNLADSPLTSMGWLQVSPVKHAYTEGLLYVAILTTGLPSNLKSPRFQRTKFAWALQNRPYHRSLTLKLSQQNNVYGYYFSQMVIGLPMSLS